MKLVCGQIDKRSNRQDFFHCCVFLICRNFGDVPSYSCLIFYKHCSDVMWKLRDPLLGNDFPQNLQLKVSALPESVWNFRRVILSSFFLPFSRNIFNGSDDDMRSSAFVLMLVNLSLPSLSECLCFKTFPHNNKVESRKVREAFKIWINKKFPPLKTLEKGPQPFQLNSDHWESGLGTKLTR